LFDRLADPGHRATAAVVLYYAFRERDPQQAERYRELMGTAEPAPGWAPAGLSARGVLSGIRQ
jgi:hypothetical protein